MAARTSRSCRRAAGASPMRCAMRVFTSPARGARANTITTQSALIGVLAGKALRRHAERIEKAQPPHEEDRAHDTARLPAPRRRRDTGSQAARAPPRLNKPAEGNALNHGIPRKAG